MFGLLLIVIAALTGVLMVGTFGGVSLDTLPAWPIAITVIATLIGLYLLTLRGTRVEYRFGGRSVLALSALAVTLAGGYLWSSHLPAVGDVVSAFKRNDTQPVVADGPAAVRLRRSDRGDFHANSEINGAALPMLIDSGSATIVLRQSDAERAGVSIDNLVFDAPLATANGTSYVAPVRLKSVRIGPLVEDDVEALVAKPGTLNENLLGMSFLRRLGSYEVRGDFATLRQ